MRQIKLADYITEINERTTEDNQYPILTSSQNGIVTQEEYFNKKVASKDTTGYKIVRYGQFTYRAMSDTGRFYINRQECCETGIVSPAYPVFEIRVNKEIAPEYLQLFFQSEYFQTLIENQSTGSTRVSLKISKIKELIISVPEYELQIKIVSIIKKLKQIVKDQREQQQYLDVLVKSRFIELFGDTVFNPFHLPAIQLSETADIVSGITKGRKTNGAELYTVPYMAVSNVKAGYIDWSTVKTIEATRNEIDQYRLRPFDVLMTEGGDPDKLGRGAIISNPPENCIHQNHIFRVRVDRTVLLPQYLEEYLQHQKAKQYFFGCAKQTTGIASINMRQLRALPVLLPPLETQTQFAAFVEQTDKSKLAVQESLQELETLKKSLMQEYFG